MNVPSDLRYTRTHEWARLDGGVLTVGITDFAQHQLSDLTYVELPKVGDEVGAGDEVAVVESVKAASDIYAPCGGVITEVNAALPDRPDLINRDPYGEGWIFKVRPASADEFDALIEPDEYEELLPGSEG
ncbi:MAG TPA: glycine cleavage system protein GcvH [Kiritimatiellia bacterium]|nr:glycine cleavage system protein GcvH [Kiritimatiellia bacterium]HRZ12647.1 glycine cleavage system protein GcvH [Kiritimatiellia bacterium]HSA19585.1 glycine cleavage system protein GcvH [Kiritimatiellia bacterium]